MSHINLNSTTPQEAKRTHYPHLLAPPSLRTSNLPNTRPQRYLNPALWDAITLGNKTAESQLQAYMWQTESTCNPTRTFTPDSVTTYDYDYDNRLTTVNLPTNNDTVEYTYDATGRRLTKEYTYHNGANTDVTTYKYHYIGSQITEIEIDSIRNPGEGQSVLRNEEVKIHLGANSQPISYEWVKHVGESTTSATYYYHYDIHGNVLKVTDSSENVKITYTYDTLGTILTESNPDSVLNFFTFRGASQTIWEPEIGMYYSGGYYRPDTGTALQGTGAPVLTNPSSGAMLNAIAEVNNANAQLAMQAMISASTAGSSSGGQPGGFSPPSGPADGMSKAGKQRTSPDPTPAPPRSNCVSDSDIGGSGGLENAVDLGIVAVEDDDGNIIILPGPWEKKHYYYIGDALCTECGKVHPGILEYGTPVGEDPSSTIDDYRIYRYFTKGDTSCAIEAPVEQETKQTQTQEESAEEEGSEETGVAEDGPSAYQPGEGNVLMSKNNKGTGQDIDPVYDGGGWSCAGAAESNVGDQSDEMIKKAEENDKIKSDIIMAPLFNSGLSFFEISRIKQNILECIKDYANKSNEDAPKYKWLKDIYYGTDGTRINYVNNVGSTATKIIGRLLFSNDYNFSGWSVMNWNKLAWKMVGLIIEYNTKNNNANAYKLHGETFKAWLIKRLEEMGVIRKK